MTAMHVLMTGGTGFIGSALSRELLRRGDAVTVYSRRPESVSRLCGEGAVAIASLDEVSALEFDAVVNLAGESIAGGLWSKSRKQKLRDSRVGLTEVLCDHLSRCSSPPRIFVNGSATGYYGDGGSTILDESAAPEMEFTHELCSDWERAADQAGAWGARVVKLRIGLVLGPGGGFLKPLMIPFRLGLGARLGSGEQWMSWISLQDIVRLVLFVLDNPDCEGVFNACAPTPVTNAEFTRALAGVLNRWTFIPVPAFALRLALGEMSRLLLCGQRAVPARLNKTGFSFLHPGINDALATALPRRPA